ncbi:MAG: asparagine synthase-related protein [Nitrospira sp.]
MPGIVGIIGRGSAGKLRCDLQQMIDCMNHESFYRSGSYINEDLGVYAGWTCHQDSYADGMPITNERGDIILLFVGEHFDDEVTKKPSKARALLQQYEEKGETFLENLNGWFSGLLVDLRKLKVILFNDRYAMRRVYYHQANDVFVFGSEAKALLKLRPELRQLELQSLGEMISCNCVLEGRTLFRGISLLPGGVVWSWVDKVGPTQDVYFKPSDWEQLTELDEATFYARLKETVLRVIPRYFREKERVGMSLTGGLDSRMMMACLNPDPGMVSCYTFGGQKDMLDITIARKVADVCGQTHTTIRLGNSFLADFPMWAERTIYVTDGSVDVSNAHDLYLNKAAREVAPIRITGKFGSEVIRDHTMFNASRYEGGLFQGDLKPLVHQAVETLRQVKKGHPVSTAVFKDFPWREYSKITIEDSQSTFRSPYMDNDLVHLMYRAPAVVRASNWPQRRIIRECNPRLSALISDRGYGEQTNPFVARMIELSYKTLFKLDYAYFFALPHWLTRVDSFLLSLTGGKPVLGQSQKFEFYRAWYHRQVANYVKDMLLDSRTLQRPYYDRKYLEMMVLAHTKGTHNFTNEITKALSLELTHRILLDY